MKPSRSKLINMVPARSKWSRDGMGLMQWSYSRRVVAFGQPCTMSAFVSVVSRPGFPGLWVAKPYYCFGGPLRFRRLPGRIALAVRVACARGWIEESTRKATERLLAHYRMARDTLLSQRARERGLFKPAEVERLIDDHVSGRELHGYRLWALLCLELWFREVVNGR